MYADILNPIVNAATDFIGSAGLAGVFVLMLLGSACIPVPSEVVMMFAGFNVSQGDLTMLGIISAGFAGNMVGSWIAYAAGYYGRLELLEKNRLVHLSPSRLAVVERWFNQHGDAAVFWTRMVPIVRAFISLPAGIARMPFWRFTALTAAGSLPWVVGFAVLGNAVGANWEKWRQHLRYADYLVVAAAVVLVVYVLVQRRKSGPGSDPAAP